jgi:hypothetical protein
VAENEDFDPLAVEQFEIKDPSPQETSILNGQSTPEDELETVEENLFVEF